MKERERESLSQNPNANVPKFEFLIDCIGPDQRALMVTIINLCIKNDKTNAYLLNIPS